MPPSDDQFPEKNDFTPPEELRRAAEKFYRRQNAIKKAEGAGATEGAQAITRKYIARLVGALKGVLSDRNRQSAYGEFLAIIRGLDPQVLALCILQGAQHSIGQRDNYRDTALRTGGLIADECWAKGLLVADNDRKAFKATLERIEARARQKGGSSEHKKKFARARALKAGYRTKNWDRELLFRAGEWALRVLLEQLPEVFTMEDGPREDDNDGEDKFLTLTEEAQQYAAAMIEQVILSKPTWLPQSDPPKPWTGWNDGGTWDKRLARSLSMVRRRHKVTEEAVRRAIRDGTMKPALDG
jgi:hypothetical protein